MACEAEAQQALATVAQGLPATRLHEVTLRPTPRYAKPGRPGKATAPAERGDHIAGGLASSLAVRDALVAPHRCVMLATNGRDARAWSPQARLAGDNGPKHAARGVRFLKAPLVLAASLDLKTPQRLMALLLVMTVWLVVYAAVEYRLRTALKAQQTTFPNQQGQPIQHPTARWGFQSFVGIHLLFRPGDGPLVLNLTDMHEHLLRLLGQPYKALYA